MELLNTPPTPPGATPAGLVGLHHATITVSDLDRGVAWYSDVLGMVQWMKESFPGGSTAGLMRPGTQLFLGLSQHDRSDVDAFAPHRHGLDHLSFAATSREELYAWQSHLRGLGVECSDVREYGTPIPFALLSFTDPDGVALEIMHIAG